jgi:hypothetical protein
MRLTANLLGVVRVSEESEAHVGLTESEIIMLK